MTELEKFVGHPTIMYCAFEAFVLEIDGHWYVQEDYQDGEIWSEDEIWGPTLYDIENRRKIEWPVYVQNDDWKDIIQKSDNWDVMDYEFDNGYDIYADAINYYTDEIDKLKSNNIC